MVCDTKDFGVGRRVTYQNWNALRVAGENASQRLCDAEAASARPAPDAATLHQVTRPSRTDDGQHAPALRFGDARVMALMTAIAGFSCLIAGFDNRTLVRRMRALADAGYSSRHATYDLPAPRGAPSYSRHSREELGRRFLGLMADLTSKD